MKLRIALDYIPKEQGLKAPISPTKLKRTEKFSSPKNKLPLVVEVEIDSTLPFAATARIQEVLDNLRVSQRDNIQILQAQANGPIAIWNNNNNKFYIVPVPEGNLFAQHLPDVVRAQLGIEAKSGKIDLSTQPMIMTFDYIEDALRNIHNDLGMEMPRLLQPQLRARGVSVTDFERDLSSSRDPTTSEDWSVIEEEGEHNDLLNIERGIADLGTSRQAKNGMFFEKKPGGRASLFQGVVPKPGLEQNNEIPPATRSTGSGSPSSAVKPGIEGPDPKDPKGPVKPTPRRSYKPW